MEDSALPKNGLMMADFNDNDGDDVEVNDHNESVVNNSIDLVEIENSTGLSKGRKIVILVLFCIVLFLGRIERTVMSPFFSTYANERNMTDTSIGLVFGCLDLSVWLSSIAWGYIVTILGTKVCFSLGIVFATVFTALFAVLPLFEDLTTFLALSITFRVIVGIASGAYFVAQVLTTISVFPDKFGTVLGIGEVAGGAGLIIAPLIGGGLYQIGGFYLPFIIIPILFISVGITALFIIPNSLKQTIDNQLNDKEDVDSELSTEDSKQDESATNNKDMYSHTWKVLLIPMFPICLGFIALFSFILTFALAFIALAYRHYGLSSLQIGMLLALMTVSYIIAAPLGGLLADRRPNWIPYQVMIGWTGFGFAVSIAGPATFYGTSLELWPLWLPIMAVFFLGIFGSTMIPTTSLCFKTVKKAGWQDGLDTHGMVSGFLMAAKGLGAGLGTIIGGIVYELIGWEWVITIFTLLLWVLAGIMLVGVLLERRTERKKVGGVPE